MTLWNFHYVNFFIFPLCNCICGLARVSVQVCGYVINVTRQKSAPRNQCINASCEWRVSCVTAFDWFEPGNICAIGNTSNCPVPLAHIRVYTNTRTCIVMQNLYRNVVHIPFSISNVELEPLMCKLTRVVVYNSQGQ